MDLFSPSNEQQSQSQRENYSTSSISSNSLNSSNSSYPAWSLSSNNISSFNKYPGILSNVKEELTEEDNFQSSLNHSTSSQSYYPTSNSFQTPPSTPTTNTSHSSSLNYQQQVETSTRLSPNSFEFSPSFTSLSSPTTSNEFYNNRNALEENFVGGKFDKIVGSPSSSRKSFSILGSPISESRIRNVGVSLPGTPMHSIYNLSERREGVKSSSWTWPSRGDNSSLTFNSSEEQNQSWNSPTKLSTTNTNPFMNSESENSNDRNMMMDEVSVGEEKLEIEEGLLTRYVKVYGVPQNSTEKNLGDLIINRYPSIKGCYTALLRSHGIVVIVFYDIRSASDSLFEISNTLVGENINSSFGGKFSLKPVCITRSSLHLLNYSLPNPLISKSEGIIILSLLTDSGFSPTIKTTSIDVNHSNLLNLLLQYGDVRTFKSIDNLNFQVEFWDERDAEKAALSLEGGRWNDEGSVSFRFSCKFEPGLLHTITSSDSDSYMSVSPQTNRAQEQDKYYLPFIPQVRLPPPQIQQVQQLRQIESHHLPNQVHSPIPAFSNFQRNQFKYDENREYVSPPRMNQNRGNSIHQPSRTFQPLSTISNNYINNSISPSFSTLPQQYSENKSATNCVNEEKRVGRNQMVRGKSNLNDNQNSQNSWRNSPANPMNSTSNSNESNNLSNSTPSWGIYRDEKIPVRNVLQLDRIERGLDVRTTLMLKNIPNRMTDVALMEYIDEAVGMRAYDFFYLRIDFSTECTVGYGFVNFINVEALLKFAKARLGTRWNLYSSDKICVASYANIQGKESLIARFKNSSIMEEVAAFRPKIFYSDGPFIGQPEPFPTSDDPHRKARSASNTNSNGLFPAFKPVFKVTQALKGLHM